MKPIAKPVCRPTTGSIWNSFLNSGKKHLILTGSRGSGKSTRLRQFPCMPLPGVTTFVEPGSAVYISDNTTGNRAKIGAFDASIPGETNKMRLCMDGFEQLGIPSLERCMEQTGKWAAVDEIGYLENGCPAYLDAMRRLMGEKRVIAAVRKQDTPFIREILTRRDVFVVDLDAPFGNAGCVIMASGLGKRFGGNKLMADFGGHPMIQRIIDATDGLFARRVVVTRHEDIAALCASQDIECVLHDLPHRSDTVRLGLEAVGDVDGCTFCPADQPLLSRDTIETLLLSRANDRESIFRPSHEGVQGSPVLFPEWAFEELMNLPEGKGGGVVVQKYPGRVKTVPVSNEYELTDADTPEILVKLKTYIEPQD